jgi:hypothetical protein
VSPATIFPTGNLLWIDGFGGVYLRDGGGDIPANGEQLGSVLDRGNVGASTPGTGVTYSSTAFGGRGTPTCSTSANSGVSLSLLHMRLAIFTASIGSLAFTL